MTALPKLNELPKLMKLRSGKMLGDIKPPKNKIHIGGPIRRDIRANRTARQATPFILTNKSSKSGKPGKLTRQNSIRTDNFLRFWFDNFGKIYERTDKYLGVTTCCYLSIRIILLYFCFIEHDIIVNIDTIFKLFLDITSSAVTRHAVQPLNDWTNEMVGAHKINDNDYFVNNFERYFSRKGIAENPCVRDIRNISAAHIPSLITLNSSFKMTPYIYYIGAIVSKEEGDHWFVFYLSSDIDYINIVSTWADNKWQVPLQYIKKPKIQWDYLLNSINTEISERTEGNIVAIEDIFTNLFLKDAIPQPFTDNDSDDEDIEYQTITPLELQKSIDRTIKKYVYDTQFNFRTPRIKYYECLNTIVEQIKPHIAKGKNKKRKRKTRKGQKTKKNT